LLYSVLALRNENRYTAPQKLRNSLIMITITKAVQKGKTKEEKETFKYISM